MTTDRELLELAAKAAGMNLGKWKFYEGLSAKFVLMLDGEPTSNWWNPLTADGDAMRLAVKLNLTIDFDVLSDGAIVNVYASWNGDFRDCFWNEWLGKDPYAATRRAIVRAAAEIGRMM